MKFFKSFFNILKKINSSTSKKSINFSSISGSPPFHGLTIVSVGPGDPSLLTIAAVEAIKKATLISFPVATSGGQSNAAQIASNWIEEDKKLMPLHFPMSADVAALREAWRLASDQLAEAVSEGQKVVFLCQGDGSLFASSSYVLLDLKKNHPECKMKLIPGVTSFSAAAAAGLWPLCMQQDQLLIAATPNDQEALDVLLKEAKTSGRVIVLMKLGHRWEWIKPVLKTLDLLDGSLFAQRVGFADQVVMKAKDVPATSRPYFSMLLIRQGWPEVLP